MAITIEQLFIYPVKSLKGVAIDSANCDIRGLEDDRRWMLIDKHNRFVSQRQLPALATLSARLTPDELILALNRAELRISRAEPDTAIESARIWSDEVQVKAEPAPVGEFLRDQIAGAPNLRLVRLAAPRPQSKPHYLGAHTHTVFADMAPLLVANQASLDALNEALLQQGLTPVPINRFRPNILVSGIQAFAEHRLAGLQNPHYTLRFAYPCERCVMTTIDQETGLKHPAMEPYCTLTQLNAMPAYGEGEHHKSANPKAPAFGENALLALCEKARIAVGDKLKVYLPERR